MNCLFKYHCHDDLVQPLLTTFKRCSPRTKERNKYAYTQNYKISRLKRKILAKIQSFYIICIKSSRSISISQLARIVSNEYSHKSLPFSKTVTN